MSLFRVTFPISAEERGAGYRQVPPTAEVDEIPALSSSPLRCIDAFILTQWLYEREEPFMVCSLEGETRSSTRSVENG